ncbi:histone deacetylase family protein [Poriferisphaera corsica]|nr:histone deacetylase [Poriferisphaera corsica]
MRTGLVYNDQFLEHDTGPGHPERPDRLCAIIDKLKQQHIYEQLIPIPFDPINIDQVHRLHDPAYTQRLHEACQSGLRFIDSDDSSISSRSYDIALLAAGGVLAAVDAIMAGNIAQAFCAIRPPGHHAEYAQSMGFCFFNNIALAADYLTDRYGLDRVAIVDFDVHHGNGTQHLLENRSDILVINIHQHPSTLYPGTGFAYEEGKEQGTGFTLNLPLQPGAEFTDYRQIFIHKIVPKLNEFKPQFLLLSAGFDASKDDPLASMNLAPSDFSWITNTLKQIAARHADHRLLSVLEGGYDLRSLAECAAAHVQSLLDDPEDNTIMKMKAGF